MMAAESYHAKATIAVETNEVRTPDWNEKTFFPFQEDQERRQARVDQHSASFPKLGIGALIGALTLIAISGVLLLVIQGPGKVVSDWTHHVYGTHRYVTIPKPAAWLSANLSGISVCLHIALSEGLNIAWWYHVRQESATVRDLHNIWGHGTSTWTVVKSGFKDLKSGVVSLSRKASRRGHQELPRSGQKHFSYVALATLFVATIPLNGFLLQNAVVVKLEPTQKNATIKVPMLNGDNFNSVQQVQAMPDYSGGGGVFEWSSQLGILSQVVTPKVAASANLGSFNTTCLGSCNTTIRGMGFRIQCEDSLRPYDIPLNPNNYNNLPTTPAVESMAVNGTDVVGINITYNIPDVNRVTLHSMWKPEGTCKGNYSVQKCHLDLATVLYPVTINTGLKEMRQGELHNTTIMTLNMDLLRESPKVDHTIAGQMLSSDDTMYPVAGLAGLFAQTLNSSINVRYSGFEYYGSSITAQGMFAQQQLATSWNNDDIAEPCHGTIGNVTEQALATINSIMFQLGAYNWLTSYGKVKSIGGYPFSTAFGVDDVSNDTPHPVALHRYERNEYKVIWPWYFGAMTVTLLVSLFILPTFWGYWRLERKTTMSPFETARAFHAPVLYQEDSTVKSVDLIKRVGTMQIHRDLPVVTVAEGGLAR